MGKKLCGVRVALWALGVIWINGALAQIASSRAFARVDTVIINNSAEAFSGQIREERTWYSPEHNMLKEAYQVKVEDRITVKHGFYKVFDESGHLWQDGQYCEGEPDGTWKIYAANGFLKQELTFVNGLRTGPFITFDTLSGACTARGVFLFDQLQGEVKLYYPSGQLKELAYYEKGQLSGELIDFYENGNLLQRVFYVAGKSSGNWEKYYPNGYLKERCLVSDGQLNGTWKHYSPENEGVLLATVSYLDGLMEGVYLEFFTGGARQIECTYQAGKQHGIYREYFENGVIYQLGNYELGARNGTWRTYFPQGTLQMEGMIGQNLLEGLWKTYYPNGNLKSYGHYEKGLAEGPWTYFYEQGGVQLTGVFEHNLRVGEWKQYYPSAIIKGRFLYQKGVKEGLAKMYNPLGQEVCSVRYRQGVRVSQSGDLPPGFVDEQ